MHFFGKTQPLRRAYQINAHHRVDQVAT